jgi:hypothetical protein
MAFQFSDGVFGTAQGVLRGMGLQTACVYINALGFWVGGVVIGYLAAFQVSRTNAVLQGTREAEVQEEERNYAQMPDSCQLSGTGYGRLPWFMHAALGTQSLKGTEPLVLVIHAWCCRVPWAYVACGWASCVVTSLPWLCLLCGCPGSAGSGRRSRLTQQSWKQHWLKVRI